ncbi:MAG: methyltransferase domain-containing protein [Syntrophorhabdales bacterium]|jgi:SAM-dependent methyltransferase
MTSWKERIGLTSLPGFRGSGVPGLDVYWEPSPRDVVKEMLKLADVRSSDVVYDLGCGDGRLVIEAARQMGARGVGIDLDPQRIKESVENAASAGVTELVRFFNKDLFKADVSEATVVMLFLFPDVNRRLRPKLISELKPSTRVLSYCHDMEPWGADRCLKVRTSYIYHWTVPANMGGQWEGEIDNPGEFIPLRLDLEQEFQRIKGTVTIGETQWRLDNATLGGKYFSFPLRGGRGGTSVEGFLDDDLAFGILGSHDTSEKSREWTARRNPATKKSLAR